MERDNLLGHVRERLGSWLFPKKFVAAAMRDTVAGAILPIMTAEVVLFYQVQASIKYGDMPWYMTDVVIMTVAFVEALTSPLFSWLGYKSRRTVMLAATGTVATVIFLLFAVPAANTAIGSDLCRGVGNWVPLGMTAPAIQRLAIVIILAIPIGIARNALLSHGVGYIAEHSIDGMSMVVGIFILVRIIGLQLFRIAIDSTMAPWMLILAVAGPLIFNLVLFFKFPPMPPLADGKPRIPSDGRGLCSSLSRVLSNSFAMTQICAMAFLGAALWGFGYHQMDIVKTKYYSLSSSGFLNEYQEILRLHIVFFAVIIIGARYVTPVMPVFRRASAAKLALIFTAISIVVYIAIVAVLNCDAGQIAGLSNNYYTQPGCSLQCGCTPALNEFSPVCMVDQMTSYLSPCHAGCSSNVTVGGVTFLGNCSCGVGRAMPGICSVSQCRNIHELHKLLFIVIMTCTTVAMQKHAVLFVRASDPRDRGVVVGVACTFVSVIVFILGHGIFLAIRATTCVWNENGICHLQNSSFPYIVGGTSAGFALISFFISVFTWFSLRRRKDPIDQSVVYEM